MLQGCYAVVFSAPRDYALGGGDGKDAALRGYSMFDELRQFNVNRRVAGLQFRLYSKLPHVVEATAANSAIAADEKREFFGSHGDSNGPPLERR